MSELKNSVAMERTVQIKTYDIRSRSGDPGRLKLCTSEWPLSDVLFPTPLWQHLRMGSLYGCWRVVSQVRDEMTRSVIR
jgi:hypothetical protein